MKPLALPLLLLALFGCSAPKPAPKLAAKPAMKAAPLPPEPKLATAQLIIRPPPTNVIITPKEYDMPVRFPTGTPLTNLATLKVYSTTNLGKTWQPVSGWYYVPVWTQVVMQSNRITHVVTPHHTNYWTNEIIVKNGEPNRFFRMSL